jgi:16S rRNA (adenine1518-N6/adenine1519-N6)-dimethyltransferase
MTDDSRPGGLSRPSIVQGLLKRHGIQPRKRYGQNFLVDGNTLAKIVAAAVLPEGASVLEIGGGLGVLTRSLAEAVGPSGRVVTVEIDPTLLPVLQEQVAGLPQVTVVHADALEIEWPQFLSERFTGSAATVVANIPYSITTPLLTALLAQKTRLRLAVFLVQREVALRLAAGPATPDYGALSVFAQFHTDVTVVGIVGKRVFIPAPDVESAIVRLTPKAPPANLRDEALFFKIVRAAFGQRRKSLLNALSGGPDLGWNREQSAHALHVSGIDPGRRGETLSIPEFVAIANSAA